MADKPFFGMRGTGDFQTDQRPENWREMILRLYPNGRAPLTAISSMLPTESTDDPSFNWWGKKFVTQGGLIPGFNGGATTLIATNTTFTTAAGAETSNTIVHAKVGEDLIQNFREGLQIGLMIAGDSTTGEGSDPDATVVAECTAVVENGANSYVSLRTHRDAPLALSANYNYIRVTGNMNEEGAEMPDPITYDPNKYNNVSQIFRTSLSITRTARKTRLRTEDEYQRAKKEALELHGIEMEYGFLLSEFVDVTGSNGKPKRATRGLLPALREYAPENVFNFTKEADAAWDGQTWENAGEHYLDYVFEKILRYGSGERLILAGSGAVLGLKRIMEGRSTYEMTQADGAYGFNVNRWITPWDQDLYIKTHPLMTDNPVFRNSMLVVTPEHLKTRTIDDTFFKGDSDRDGTNRGKDALDEEWLTEIGMEYHFLNGMGAIHGVGHDNPA